jgi:hypothetical protein
MLIIKINKNKKLVYSLLQQICAGGFRVILNEFTYKVFNLLSGLVQTVHNTVRKAGKSHETKKQFYLESDSKIPDGSTRLKLTTDSGES